MLPRLATYDTYMRSFKYEILNNILFLNKKFHLSITNFNTAAYHFWIPWFFKEWLQIKLNKPLTKLGKYILRIIRLWSLYEFM